jgi:ATP-dependent Zn protease
MIDGFSGAEIENMINQAALNCVRQARLTKNENP